MRPVSWLILAVLLVAVGGGAFMLTPVRGPARDLTLVGDAARGAYLLKLGGCVACHTDPKNKTAVFAGSSAGLVTAFGTFFPPNITPSKTAGIGAWTAAEFAAALSDGEGPVGHLYPAFPYDSYTLMSDQEVADLRAALLAVPANDTPSRAHEVAFPFNQRFLLAGWKHLFFHPRRYADDPAKSAEWNRGRYIVFGPGHCVACHSPRNPLGGIDVGTELSGNPDGGPAGKTPSLLKADLTKHDYDQAALAEVLRSGTTSGADNVLGAMVEIVAEETSQWTAADRAAVAHYLTGGD
jgi:mono/diheme cytochrome c family protein